MRLSRTLRRMAGVAVVGLVVVAGAAIPAGSTSVPPQADPGLIGTWTNENAGPGTLYAIEKVVISSSGGGRITVDSFGTCGGSTLCEYGKVSAVVFGPAADSARGRFFEANQNLGTYNRILLGQLVDTTAGPRIKVSRYVAYKDGSRHNSVLSYQFKRSTTSTASATKAGAAAAGYPSGLQPRPVNALIGTWNNTNANTRGIIRLVITRAGDESLLVHAFGKCSPTPCDIGTFPAITYGDSSLSTSGLRFLAPNDEGFKKEIYTGQLSTGTGTLKVTYYSEYTDSSGRSNFALPETFAP